jgi:16S rRNA processing protein RimM
LAAISLSSRPERFQQLGEVFLFHEGKPVGVGGFQVESVREHARAWIFKFRGVDTISDAEPLEHAEVRIPLAERLAVAEGEHYVSDLMGCEVNERCSGGRLGVVTGWQEAGGAGLLEVGDGDDKLLVPFARSICVEVDTRAKRILVDLPEGLKDLNHP